VITVLDMEWTSWEGAWARGWSGPGEFREIVQIGLVRFADTPVLEELESFQVFVKPILNPTLSRYFMDLTGISQDDVDRHGTSLADALTAMTEFLADDQCPILSHGLDGKYLRENCEKIDIAFGFEDDRFVDIRADVQHFLGHTGSGLTSSDLPARMGFPAPGTAHDAVADCRCIGGALRIMRGAGAF